MKSSKFTVYILKTSKDTLYTGYTSNLDKRLSEHQSHNSRGSKYMRYFSSFELVYKEGFSSRSEAMKKEAALKKLSRKQKEALVGSTSYSSKKS